MNDLISVTTVVEHVFCPKFTYYGHVLGLKQYEEKRSTVILGKELHSRHEKTNVNFIPNRIQGRKLISLHLYSKKYFLSGKIDEAIETNDEVILVERKYSDNAIVGPSIKTQLGLLSILIEENMKKPVKRSIVIFSKEERKIVNIEIDDEIKKYALNMLSEVKNIIKTGINPHSKFDNRCMNCCFRKICPVGSLNTV